MTRGFVVRPDISHETPNRGIDLSTRCIKCFAWIRRIEFPFQAVYGEVWGHVRGSGVVLAVGDDNSLPLGLDPEPSVRQPFGEFFPRPCLTQLRYVLANLLLEQHLVCPLFCVPLAAGFERAFG